MNKEIGAFEAKTKLPELLRQVQGGKKFTITNRGKPIADLVPCETTNARNTATAIARYMVFREANPVCKSVDIRALIEEGRE
ncbi:MAG: type II toxin-antitoxin system prevent-host-death family antitoxin [Proteobacteria bacterium]|nr:type II toxin-antitoxin system prevent-host-death family antitoxin [Pseudomonadota bacterium]